MLEAQVNALRRELEQSRSAAPPPSPPTTATPTSGAPVAAPVVPAEPGPGVTPVTQTTAPSAPRVAPWLSDFKIGGYGSVRFESSDVQNAHDTFTFRRFVLTGDATIAERLRSVVEVEFERLNELEIERKQPVEEGRRGFSNSIEGSDGSRCVEPCGAGGVDIRRRLVRPEEDRVSYPPALVAGAPAATASP
jgi:hypothetical protein